MEENNYSYRHSNQEVSEEGSINFREILDFFWRLRWWIVGAMGAALVLAFFIVRMQTPTYQRAAWIMLNRNDGNNAEMSLLTELSGRTVTKRVDNEVFIIKSPTLMSKVVKDLGLNTRYFTYQLPIGNGRVKIFRGLFDFKRTEFYTDHPFTMEVTQDPLYPDAMHPWSIFLEFKHREDGFSVRKLRVNGHKFKPSQKQYAYGEPVNLAGFGFSLVLTLDTPAEMIRGDKYVVTWNTPFATAQGFLSHLTAETQGSNRVNQSDVVFVSMTDVFPRRAEDILNALVAKTNQESRDYKNISTLNTIEFIDGRLGEIAKQLEGAEQDMRNYQSSRVVVDLGSQTNAAVSSDMQYQNQLTDVRLQLQVLDMITNYLAETPAGTYKVIPTNIGVTDAGLNSIITNDNNLVSERNRMVANSSESNPRVLNMNSQLEDSRKSIELSIANLVKVYTIRERE